MIGNAKKSIVLSTFDLRSDDSGTKIIAALYTAAERGVQVQILIDGIYQKLFLENALAGLHYRREECNSSLAKLRF